MSYLFLVFLNVCWVTLRLDVKNSFKEGLVYILFSHDSIVILDICHIEVNIVTSCFRNSKIIG